MTSQVAVASQGWVAAMVQVAHHRVQVVALMAEVVEAKASIRQGPWYISSIADGFTGLLRCSHEPKRLGIKCIESM